MPLNKEYLLKVFETLSYQRKPSSSQTREFCRNAMTTDFLSSSTSYMKSTYSDDPLIAYSSFGLTATPTEEWRRQKDRSSIMFVPFATKTKMYALCPHFYGQYHNCSLSFNFNTCSVLAWSVTNIILKEAKMLILCKQDDEGIMFSVIFVSC